MKGVYARTPIREMRRARRKERNTAGKGEQQGILKRSNLPWRSEF